MYEIHSVICSNFINNINITDWISYASVIYALIGADLMSRVHLFTLAYFPKNNLKFFSFTITFLSIHIERASVQLVFLLWLIIWLDATFPMSDYTAYIFINYVLWRCNIFKTYLITLSKLFFSFRPLTSNNKHHLSKHKYHQLFIGIRFSRKGL